MQINGIEIIEYPRQMEIAEQLLEWKNGFLEAEKEDFKSDFDEIASTNVFWAVKIAELTIRLERLEAKEVGNA